MPLERLSATPAATVDPRLARRRKAEELKSERSTPAIPGSSSGGSVGPERAASTSSRDPRRTTTPYTRSLSSKPAPTIFPHSMHAQHERGKIYCGSCLEYHPESDFASKQLSDARRSIARAEREHRELKASDFPKCRRGINQQILEIRCVECGETKQRHDFSEAMKANPYGATCKTCQRVAVDVKDRMRREECVPSSAQQPQAELTCFHSSAPPPFPPSSRLPLLPLLLLLPPPRSIEADPWAAYESSDEEGDAAAATGPSRPSAPPGAAASAAPAWDADEAYGVRRGLGTVAEEGGGGAGGTGVVYDDDEDW